jgi:uncharacterized RDD family membrane protein YckC
VNEVSSEQQSEGVGWEPIDTAVIVETPEHVRFRYLLAGPSRRMAAYAVDSMLRLAVFFVAVLLAIGGGFDPKQLVGGFATGMLWLLGFVLEWAYFVLFETMWDGQSPGKRALHLRVVNAAGRPLGFVDSVLRNVLRAADYLPGLYALGLLVMATDARFRRLGDFVAGTLVIAEDPRRVEGELPRFAPPTLDEMAEIPAHVRLLPSEVEAIELLLRRRPRLSEARANELADRAAVAIAQRTGLRYRTASRWLEVLYGHARGGTRGHA